MKKIKITLIIMIALAAAAAIVYFIAGHFSEKNAKKAADNANKLVIFNFNESSITRLKIHNESGDYEMTYNNTDSWKMVSDVDFEVNSNTAINICSAMHSLTAQKIIEDDDKSKFGFDDPIIITVTADSKDYTLYVGDAAPTNESRYVMKEGSDSIYLIDYSTGAILSATKDLLKSEYIADLDPGDVDHFALWKGAENDDNILFSMTKDKNNGWYMEKPYKDNSVYLSDITTFINDAIRDKIYSFVQEGCSEEEYGKFGFDDPKYVLEISGAGKYIKVIFGSYLNNDTEMYGLFTETGQVVTFYKNSVAALGYDTASMMNKTIFPVTLDEISAVEVAMPDGTAKLEIDNAAQKYTLNGKKLDLDNSEASDAYFGFVNSFRDAYFESVDKNAKPQGDPEITVKYTLTDGSETNIEYIPVPGGDSNTYWAVRDGDYTGFIVRKKVVAYISSSFKEADKLVK